MKSAGRILFLIAGIICLGLGVLGAFLPVLPTTPFAILAAACFARSSERIHQWLLALPLIGPNIRDWEDRHVIRTRIKVFATAIALLVFAPAIYWLEPPLWASGPSAILLLLGLLFIWSRNSGSRSKSGD